MAPSAGQRLVSPAMWQIRPELASHPDRLRWNARYGGDFVPDFAPHPLAQQALSMRPPAGPVLELACGPSGSALLAAAAGRRVTAVDASDVALELLAAEAARRGLASLLTLTHADLSDYRPDGGYALVLCTGFWDPAVFGIALDTVPGDGLVAWEALTEAARQQRPSLPARWCLGPGQPASLLPAGFAVVEARDVRETRRRLLARRRVPG
jgi:SAM-dependent methyltransferase